MPAGVLTKKEIKDLELIQDAEEECYKPASYDLRLGRECVFPHDQEAEAGLKVECLSESHSLTIPPFASVIVSTYEKLKIPDNVIGKFNLRIRVALKGLIVQMGTQIEPLYEGRLFALLQNISNKEIQLKFCDTDDRIFTVEFYYTTQPVEGGRRCIEGLNDMLQGEAPVDGTLNSFVKDIETTKTELAEINSSLKEFEGRLNDAVSKVFSSKAVFLSVLATILFTLTAPTAITYIADHFRSNNSLSLGDFRKIEEELRDIENKIYRLEGEVGVLRNTITGFVNLNRQLRIFEHKLHLLEVGKTSNGDILKKNDLDLHSPKLGGSKR